MEPLWRAGATVRAYDSAALDFTRTLYGDRSDLVLCNSRDAALSGSDCLAVVTEWPEFLNPDLGAIRNCLSRPAIFDGRNIFDTPRSARGFDISRRPTARSRNEALVRDREILRHQNTKRTVIKNPFARNSRGGYARSTATGNLPARHSVQLIRSAFTSVYVRPSRRNLPSLVRRPLDPDHATALVATRRWSDPRRPPRQFGRLVLPTGGRPTSAVGVRQALPLHAWIVGLGLGLVRHVPLRRGSGLTRCCCATRRWLRTCPRSSRV